MMTILWVKSSNGMIYRKESEKMTRKEIGIMIVCICIMTTCSYIVLKDDGNDPNQGTGEDNRLSNNDIPVATSFELSDEQVNVPKYKVWQPNLKNISEVRNYMSKYFPDIGECTNNGQDEYQTFEFNVNNSTSPAVLSIAQNGYFVYISNSHTNQIGRIEDFPESRVKSITAAFLNEHNISLDGYIFDSMGYIGSYKNGTSTGDILGCSITYRKQVGNLKIMGFDRLTIEVSTNGVVSSCHFSERDIKEIVGNVRTVSSRQAYDSLRSNVEFSFNAKGCTLCYYTPTYLTQCEVLYPAWAFSDGNITRYVNAENGTVYEY